MAELAQLDQTRQTYRAQLQTALVEDEDPLAAYESFIKWTIDNYPPHLIPKSGLLELLEEAARQFKGDPAYKGDLRYTKLWMQYAAYVDDERQHTAIPVYKFLIQNDIGTVYAQVYEEYAAALERAKRHEDAERVFLYGIKRRARPVERLKKRYTEFQARASAKSAAPPRSTPSSHPLPPASAWKDASPEAQTIRRHPLKNFQTKSSSSSASASAAASSSASTSAPAAPAASATTSSGIDPSIADHPALTRHGHARYAPMLTPTPPGKRPEKLRFNLSLLFTDDGMEYSVQEARARSMGLLGKKWGPPPVAELQRFASSTSSAASLGSSNSSAGAVKANRNPTITRRGFGGGYAEPTVTLATKEALADVFGMYNSPEKTTMLSGPAAGSKHAPVRKIEPITPVGGGSLHSAFAKAKADENAKTPMAVYRDENAKTPIPVFRDENAGVNGKHAKENAKENAVTPGPSKFQIYVDPSSNAQTPNPAREPRRALTSKEPSTPASVSNENAQSGLRTRKDAAPLGSVTEEDEVPPAAPAEERKVFSVFTPAAPSAPAQDAGSRKPSGLSRKDIFIDEPQPTKAATAPPQPFKVFSRPPSANPGLSENASASAPPPQTAPQRKPAFTPFVDSAPSSSSEPPRSSSRPPLGERSHTPLQAISTPSTSTDSDADGGYPVPMTSNGEYYGESESTQSSDVDDTEAPPGMDALDARTPAHSDAEGEEGEYDDEYYDDTEERPAGRSYEGRLGRLNLMTPITERTMEYTSTGVVGAMSARGTPGSVSSVRAYSHIGLEKAQEHAEMLAAELREEDEDEYEEQGEDVGMMEERTGTLSLSDAIARASSFAPPNPCNPFEGPIISSLLSIIPPDSAFHDLRMQESGRLDALQKFARKKERRSSGNTSRGSSGGDEPSLRVELGGQTYDVLSKLGEGGFGAVFEAIDVGAAAAKRGRRDDDDDDFDDDDDEDDEDAIPKVALKVVKPRSIWEFHVLRRIHNTLSPYLKRSIVTPSALYAFKDESFLVLELRKQGTLLDIVNRAPQAGITQQGACLDELLVVFFTIELLRLLGGLHAAGFIHGDVKIDNCLLRLEDVPGPASAWASVYDPAGGGGWAHKGITLIDFGRTIDTKLFPPAQRFVGDWPTDARDCFELRAGAPWTFQTDYFGLAGIVYCMLYGKYIEASSVVPAPPAPDGRPRYKLATPFKRYWQGELWTRLFDLLLNPTLVRPDGQLPLCEEMEALRDEMEAWLQANCNRASNSLKGLLKKVGLSVLGGKDGR